MVYQATSHDDISKSFQDLMAVEGKQSSEVIHVHDQPTTPIVVTTAVRMSAPDVESQESTVPEAMEENTTIIDDDDNAGKGMGIAIFVLLIIGTVSAFFIPLWYIGLASYIFAFVLASVLTCGCCCAKNYNLKPHVKIMATATLVTLVLLFISKTTWYINGTMILIPSIIGYVLTGLALIFSGIFTWGRKCGATGV